MIVSLNVTKHAVKTLPLNLPLSTWLLIGILNLCCWGLWHPAHFAARGPGKEEENGLGVLGKRLNVQSLWTKGQTRQSHTTHNTNDFKTSRILKIFFPLMKPLQQLLEIRNGASRCQPASHQHWENRRPKFPRGVLNAPWLKKNRCHHRIEMRNEDYAKTLTVWLTTFGNYARNSRWPQPDKKLNKTPRQTTANRVPRWTGPSYFASRSRRDERKTNDGERKKIASESTQQDVPWPGGRGGDHESSKRNPLKGARHKRSSEPGAPHCHPKGRTKFYS